MTRTTVTAVEQPRGSVRFGTHRLKAISIIGGFLDGTTFELADGLNCIIGARGTGKTTVLELVRFALDALPSAKDGAAGRRRIESLIQQNLGGGRVELTIETKDGLSYVVTRAIGEEPIVLNAEGKATEITLKAGGLFKADIYSQNEVERIADRSLSQLNLIDNFEAERIAAVTTEIRSVQQALNANAGQIAPLQSRIAALTEELAALPGVEEKLKGYSDTGGQNAEVINEAHALKALRDREKRAVEGMGRFLTEYASQIDGFGGQIGGKANSLFGRDVGTGPNATAMAAIKQAMLDCGADVDAALETARRQIDAALDDLTKAWQSLSVRHNEQELPGQGPHARHRHPQCAGGRPSRQHQSACRVQAAAFQGRHDRVWPGPDRDPRRDHRRADRARQLLGGAPAAETTP